MNRKQKPLHVSLRVAEPSVVELTVGDTVQLDRLTRSSRGCLAERCAELLIPGTTMLHLEQGDYFFRTLSDAHLKIVSGGVDATVEANDPKNPLPPPLAVPGQHQNAIARGDEPRGEAPALFIDHVCLRSL